MAFERWGYHFEGAFQTPNLLPAMAGVYVVWCQVQQDWSVLDVGESGDVQTRLLNHDRADCWQRNCGGTIWYSAAYTPNTHQAGRIAIEQQIRQACQPRPPCGER